MYVLVKNNQVIEYPCSVQKFRKENPNISFPAEVTNEQLAEFGINWVYDTPKPAYQIGKVVSEGNPELFSTGEWRQVWEVRDATESELTQQKANLLSSITANTQNRLDLFAKTRNYDGILSACTYATSAVEKFRIEGQYCVDARDSTWAKLYEILAQVESGERPMPTGYSDIESELPSLTWPA